MCTLLEQVIQEPTGTSYPPVAYRLSYVDSCTTYGGNSEVEITVPVLRYCNPETSSHKRQVRLSSD